MSFIEPASTTPPATGNAITHQWGLAVQQDLDFLNTTVTTAQSTANAAQSTANAAAAAIAGGGSAAAALTAAQAAQTSANTAQTAASSAYTLANTAETAAIQAQNSAGAAQITATNASNAAAAAAATAAAALTGSAPNTNVSFGSVTATAGITAGGTVKAAAVHSTGNMTIDGTVLYLNGTNTGLSFDGQSIHMSANLLGSGSGSDLFIVTSTVANVGKLICPNGLGVNSTGTTLSLSSANIIGMTSSLAMYKTNIRSFDDDENPVLKIQPRKFFYNPETIDDPGDWEDTGFVVDELLEIAPEIVTHGSDGPTSYSERALLAYTIAALQSAERRIGVLEASLATKAPEPE
jgi:hypothetical protein